MLSAQTLRRLACQQAGRQTSPMQSIFLSRKGTADLHAVKHAVGVKVKVARGLPELCLGNVWCVEQLVALPEVGVLQAAMLASSSITSACCAAYRSQQTSKLLVADV